MCFRGDSPRCYPRPLSPCLRWGLSFLHHCVSQATWTWGLQGFSCFHLLPRHVNTRITDTSCYSHLYMGSEGSKSDCHACVASALPTQPSTTPSPHCLVHPKDSCEVNNTSEPTGRKASNGWDSQPSLRGSSSVCIFF